MSSGPRPLPVPPRRHLVLVPLRSFVEPMTRLREVLSPSSRARLTRTLAGAVLDAADGSDVAVISNDADVIAWAAGRGAAIVEPDRPGLNAAITAGFLTARSGGFAMAAVAPADLARPDRLGTALDRASAAGNDTTVSAVPDRHRDGTNLLVVPTTHDFVFAYGPGSFERHRAEAHRLGLRFEALDEATLGWDVDTAEDLDWYRSHHPSPG